MKQLSSLKHLTLVIVRLRFTENSLLFQYSSDLFYHLIIILSGSGIPRLLGGVLKRDAVCWRMDTDAW